MKFTDLFVKRPVLAIVVNLVILIAGLQAIRSLSVRQYPRSDIAVVSVSTVYVGASADLDSVVSEISQQVRLLDGLVRYRFGGNAELMGAWASARNVAGPFRSHGAPPAGGVTPDVVRPAA